MIKKFFKLIAVAIVISSLVFGWYWNEYNVFLQTPILLSSDSTTTGHSAGSNIAQQTFTIEKGSTVRQIARLLQQQKIIEHPEYFRLYTRLSKQAAIIKAGEYTLKPGMTVFDMVKLFVSGKVNQYALTIVEGWTFKQALRHIENDANLVKTLAGTKNSDHNAVASALGTQYSSLEGLIYPDTYNFPKGTTDVQFLKRSYDNMQKVLDQEWQQREKNLPLKTPYEALILASIVEKESGVSSERNKIAGVFIRRMNKKMRLQSDPTIIYGMGERYKGNIRRRDITEKTAYNTYQIDGLPPTPIALAGREAIHSVLHPEQGKSLYFVADGSGGHVFTNSLKEHNRAVRKYILKKK
ncbi:MAG: endolytic transglycosylase MltG [Gammaproteobacteria bacterium]|nr:endolytic transglycosylase MltG [Gammaproteobacteria bacterium]